MKPTQRDSYESLWNALHEIDSAAVFLPTFEVTHDGGIEAVTKNIVDAIKKAVVALERFGAGGGEPFGYFCDWGDHDGLQRIAMYYGEPGSATFDDWHEYPKVHKNLPLYTHPSPTDLRNEYLRGLEDAAKVCETFNEEHQDCNYYDRAMAEAIRKLKGKQ